MKLWQHTPVVVELCVSSKCELRRGSQTETYGTTSILYCIQLCNLISLEAKDLFYIKSSKLIQKLEQIDNCFAPKFRRKLNSLDLK
jgi:hypothetical protein